MNSIFQRSNPAIEKLFADAGSPKKVMCIPIDYAKRQHTALVCNGEGMQLRGAFNIHNTAEGVDFLEDIIKGLCKKHSIRKCHVFFGGEDCTAFCYNFIHALLERKYLGIGINAYEAAEARQNQLASTDKLDLLGIASVLINKKHGRTLSTEYGQARLMRELTHQLLGQSPHRLLLPHPSLGGSTDAGLPGLQTKRPTAVLGCLLVAHGAELLAPPAPRP